jgi:methanogenic corrinoid protein MtbC1
VGTKTAGTVIPDIRLDQLSRMTGLSPLLIRAWERRYSFPIPVRTAGGHRRYTATQAEVLRRAAALTRSGFRAAEAIARARADPPGKHFADPPSVADLGNLMTRGSPVAAIDRLRGAWLTMGLDATIEELVMPALREIGAGWASGRLTVDQEHIATGVVMSWLGLVRAELPAPRARSPRFLIATPAGEEHGVAVWALELLLRLRGVASIALGTSIPAPYLAAAVRRHHPAGIVLAIARRSMRPAVVTVAQARGNAAEGTAKVYVGGAGAVAPLAAGVVALPSTLTASADFLTESLRSG